MYTATITEKKILEQHDYVLLTVVLKSDTPVPAEVKKDKKGKEIKEFVMDGEKVKLDKEGNPKEKKPDKQKFITKTIYFKFKIETPFSEMKAEIKAKIKALEKIESEEIPIGEPLELNS
jgi:hypothetical protein